MSLSGYLLIPIRHEVIKAFLGICLPLFIALVMSTSVKAAPRSQKQILRESRREILKGERAFKKKSYREALKHFLKAEDLVPNVKNKISIAILYHKLDQCNESFYAWIDVISQCSDGCPYQQEIQESYQNMTRSCTAPLIITSAPSASVLVDGRYLGMTPLNPPLLFGSHKLELKADGYQTIEKRVQIEPLGQYDQAIHVDVTLEPLFGNMNDQSLISPLVQPQEVTVSQQEKWRSITRFVSLGLGVSLGSYALISHWRDPPYAHTSFLITPSKGNQFLLLGSALFIVTGVVTFF